jgi:hypothetical protein
MLDRVALGLGNGWDTEVLMSRLGPDLETNKQAEPVPRNLQGLPLEGNRESGDAIVFKVRAGDTRESRCAA